jgi:hypothetical protein
MPKAAAGGEKILQIFNKMPARCVYKAGTAARPQRIRSLFLSESDYR